MVRIPVSRPDMDTDADRTSPGSRPFLEFEGSSVDPDRIGIIGGSYGGYMVLAR